MIQRLFYAFTMIGSEWVLWLLLGLSVISIALIIERILFYQSANRLTSVEKENLRDLIDRKNWNDSKKIIQPHTGNKNDPTVSVANAVLAESSTSIDALTQISQNALLQARVSWDKNLALLATIGSNAPFIGLFGTVLGIIKAFHDLSYQGNSGALTVSSGISEALVATAVGLMVAIPALIAYNLFQRRVKKTFVEADALKSLVIGKRLAGE